MDNSTTVRIDVQRLQILNDRLCQTLEALNQVRMSAQGFAPVGYGYAPGYSPVGYGYAPAGFGSIGYGIPQQNFWGAPMYAGIPTFAPQAWTSPSTFTTPWTAPAAWTNGAARTGVYAQPAAW